MIEYKFKWGKSGVFRIGKQSFLHRCAVCVRHIPREMKIAIVESKSKEELHTTYVCEPCAQAICSNVQACR